MLTPYRQRTVPAARSGREYGAQRPKPETRSQALEREIDRIRQHGAGRLDHQDVLGDRCKIRAEMDRALERQEPRPRGLDAEMAEDRLIGRLHLAGGGHHANPADPQQCHGPSFIWAPPYMGPVPINSPSPRDSTTKRPWNGRWPGAPDLPPRSRVIVAPWPAA